VDGARAKTPEQSVIGLATALRYRKDLMMGRNCGARHDRIGYAQNRPGGLNDGMDGSRLDRRFSDGQERHAALAG
jgi:hypothetical protein